MSSVRWGRAGGWPVGRHGITRDWSWVTQGNWHRLRDRFRASAFPVHVFNRLPYRANDQLSTGVNKLVHKVEDGIMRVEGVWEDALAHIESRVPKQIFDTWFLPLHFNGVDDSSVRVEVPNRFFGEWLTEHYGDLLSEAFASATGREGRELAITFVTNGKPAEKSSPAEGNAARSAPPTRLRKTAHLNPKYTFESFVVGA